MAKKIVELKSKKKIELKEMSLDDVDYCNDLTSLIYKDGEVSHIKGLSSSRTAWLRRGIKGGDFKGFKTNDKGFVDDSVIKQLSEDERNELVSLIQDYQSLGE